MSPGFASSFTSLRETPHALDTGDAVVCSSIDRRSDVGVVVVVVVRAEATGYFPPLMSPGFASSFTSLRETPHALDTGDAAVCSSIDRRSSVGVVVRAEATGYFPSLMSPGFASSFTSLRETPHARDTGDAVLRSSIKQRSERSRRWWALRSEIKEEQRP